MVVVALAIAAVVGLVLLWPRGEAPALFGDMAAITYVDATVVSATEGVCPGVEALAPTTCQNVVATVSGGGAEGDVARFSLVDSDFSLPELAAGDRVVLVRNASAPPGLEYGFSDFQRATPLLGLVALFVLAVLVFARLGGLRALVGLGASLGVVAVFLLPALLRDRPPLAVALTATVVIAFVALYLAHGVSWPTTVALAGTLLSVVVVGALGAVFVHLAAFTGLPDQAAQVLRVSAEAVDLRGLLVAGMVIGALGVLDDVTVTQVAAVEELRTADPYLGRRKLYQAALRIGRDHVASTVNTLVLAYVGASLPLMLLFVEGNRSLTLVATSEVVAIEIVRMLVGSIGIVLAVPVTTALATVVLPSSPPRAVRPSPSGWGDFGPLEDPTP